MPELEGYKLTKHWIQASLPCQVDVMFRVSDMQRKGVPDLGRYDFRLTENRMDISFDDTGLLLKNRKSASYSFRVVLVLENNKSGGDFDEVKKAAKAFVNNLSLQQEVAIYTCSRYATLIQDFTSNVEALNLAIDGITTDDQELTDLYGSILSGVLLWEEQYSRDRIEEGAMIVVTDEGHSLGTTSMKNLIHLMRHRLIYTIGVGEEHDSDALKELGGSKYSSLSSYTALAEKLSFIQEELVNYMDSFYWISYLSQQKGGYIDIELTVNNNPNGNSNFAIKGSILATGFHSVPPGVSIQGGVDTLYLNEAGSKKIDVTTYYPTNTPDYEWYTSDEELLTLAPLNEDQSSVIISAIGAEGQNATIFAYDIANESSDTLKVQFTSNPFGQFTDSRDGQTYQTVRIGQQIWFAENLNFKSANGSCTYGYNPSNGALYGRLYNWESAKQSCPSGWHVPSDHEWKELEVFLGMDLLEANKIFTRGWGVGTKLKSKTGWGYSTYTTNESGFSALPGGKGYQDSVFHGRGSNAYFWTSTEGGFYTRGFFRALDNTQSAVWREEEIKSDFLSVRCVKD